MRGQRQRAMRRAVDANQSVMICPASALCGVGFAGAPPNAGVPPFREDQVKAATTFLTHPKVVKSSASKRIAFLESKVISASSSGRVALLVLTCHDGTRA
jgi:hypothetical protein